MPYKLRKSPKNGYWVVNKETGKKYSKSPLPLARAQAQMRALYAVENGYVLNRSKSKSKKSKSMRGGYVEDIQESNQNESVILGGGAKSKRRKSPKRWVSKVTNQLEHPGSLTRKASRAGKDTHTFACEVLKSPSKYTLQTRKQAQFFVNINKHNKC